MTKIDLSQVLVPGIIDYNYSFIEAATKTHREVPLARHLYQFVNSDDTVILRTSDISSVSVDSRPGNIEGDDRIIVIIMQNSARYEFTYQTGNAIRILWKRKMKDRGVAFSHDQDTTRHNNRMRNNQ